MTHLPTTRATVTATGLVKIYGTGDTAVRALDGVSITFHAERFTSIMGPSGSGKSTLMHCVAGLDTVTRGTVHLSDRRRGPRPDPGDLLDVLKRLGA